MRLIASIKRNDIFASNGKPALHFCRGLCVSLQNLNISLFLLFFWAPFNLPSYLLGVSVGLSAVCCLLLPKGEIKASLSCWKPFLPLLALFVLLCLTIFYACNRTAAIASCAGQLAFLLIPFVFFGMSPVFFSPGRIRSFSFLLVIGSLIEVIVRAVVLTRCFLSVPELENYRLAGFWPSLNEFLSFQAIYMSFAGMKMPMHTTIEALFINTAFIIVFLARIYGNRFLSTPLRRRLADISLFLFAVSLLTSNSKTGQTMFVLSLLCLIVLAFCRHRRHLAGGILVTAAVFGCLLFPFVGKGIVGRFSQSLHVMNDAHKHNPGTVESDGSALPRLYCWKIAGDMIRERPLTGWSADSHIRFKNNFIEKYPFYRNHYQHPHNQFLFIWMTTGITGLVLLLWFWVEAIRLASKERRLFWWLWLFMILCFCLIDVFFYCGLFYFVALYGILIVTRFHKQHQTVFPAG